MFLCVNGLGILSNIASARHSDTWKALSFLLHYTRSKKEFPRNASCLKIINLLKKLRGDDNNDLMMMIDSSRGNGNDGTIANDAEWINFEVSKTTVESTS